MFIFFRSASDGKRELTGTLLPPAIVSCGARPFCGREKAAYLRCFLQFILQLILLVLSFSHFLGASFGLSHHFQNNFTVLALSVENI